MIRAMVINCICSTQGKLYSDDEATMLELRSASVLGVNSERWEHPIICRADSKQGAFLIAGNIYWIFA